MTNLPSFIFSLGDNDTCSIPTIGKPGLTAIMDVDARVEEIFYLFGKHGTGDYIGEAVSKSSHMIQCAMLAEEEGFPLDVCNI